MTLSADDKLWIEGTVSTKLTELGNQLVDTIPKGIKYNLTVACLGFMAAAATMDIKNKDIPHLSYPLQALEQLLLESAGAFAVWTGGYLADYNRMYPEPSTSQIIIGLSYSQAQQLMLAMRKRESSDNYSIIHTWAYLGAYGMGAAALADIGYIDIKRYKTAPSAVKTGSDRETHLAFLQDNSNWAKYSYEEFMSNKTVQDQAFIALANLNIRRGFSSGALKRGDHKRLAGYAAAAHLVGHSNALLYYGSNMDSDDRNGSTASEYAKLGERSITGLPPKDTGIIPDGLPMDKSHYIRTSSEFGYRRLGGKVGYHGGMDFPVPTGTEVRATADGKVIFAGNYGGACGYGIKIQHGSEYSTVFCHLSETHVWANNWVRKGAVIGLSGGAKGSKGAGSSTGPHIHYTIKRGGKSINPKPFIWELNPDSTFTVTADRLPIIGGKDR